LEKITFLVFKEEDGYVAKSEKESIFTQGDTIEELKENIKDAIKCHFDEKPPQKIILKIEETISV